jgi:hypothetical protein
MKGLNKLGGAAFIGSGLLFLLRATLDTIAGEPPSGGIETLAWVRSHSLIVGLDSEILFFASVFLVPAVIALYRSLAGFERLQAAIGCGLLALVIPVLMVLPIIHGRLAYPVYGIRVDTPDLAALLVAVFYGGLHAIGLLLGFATIVLSLAMRTEVYGKPITYLGFAAAGFDIVGAYPDAIGPVATLVSQTFVAAWFCVVGSRLYRIRDHRLLPDD